MGWAVRSIRQKNSKGDRRRTGERESGVMEAEEKYISRNEGVNWSKKMHNK